jgi:hypothetical protein
MCLFIDDNTCGSLIMGHQLIFTRPRRLVYRGQDVAAQSTGLHDPLTFSSRLLAEEHPKILVFSATIYDLEVLQQQV